MKLDLPEKLRYFSLTVKAPKYVPVSAAWRGDSQKLSVPETFTLKVDANER